MPQKVEDNQYNVWIGENRVVGSQLSVSSGRSAEYKISAADYVKLHGFLPNEATAHMPLKNPVKGYIVFAIGGAVLVFGIAFLIGFWALRKRGQTPRV